MNNVTACVSAALLSTILCTASHAQKAKPLPAPVKAWVDNMAKECRASGGKAGMSMPFEEAEFNGDKVTDYLVRHEDFKCSTWGATYFCGSAGCSATVMVSGPAGHKTQWGGNFQDIQIDRAASPNQLNTVLHGDPIGAKSRRVTFAWDARSAKFQPVNQKR